MNNWYGHHKRWVHDANQSYVARLLLLERINLPFDVIKPHGGYTEIWGGSHVVRVAWSVSRGKQFMAQMKLQIKQ